MNREIGFDIIKIGLSWMQLLPIILNYSETFKLHVIIYCGNTYLIDYCPRSAESKIILRKSME